MGNVAIIVGMLLCIAAGWIAGDWQRQRIAAAETAVVLKSAEESGSKLLAAERRIQQLQQRASQQGSEVRQGIAADASLRDCPLPIGLSDGLLRQAARTRIPYADRDRADTGEVDLQ